MLKKILHVSQAEEFKILGLNKVLFQNKLMGFHDAAKDYLEEETSDWSGPILESKGMHPIFQKKGKKGQNIWNYGQKCIKFENILRNYILCMKQLEYVLPIVFLC